MSPLNNRKLAILVALGTSLLAVVICLILFLAPRTSGTLHTTTIKSSPPAQPAIPEETIETTKSEDPVAETDMAVDSKRFKDGLCTRAFCKMVSELGPAPNNSTVESTFATLPLMELEGLLSNCACDAGVDVEPARQISRSIMSAGDLGCEYPEMAKFRPGLAPPFSVNGLSPLYGPLATSRFILAVREIMLRGEDATSMRQRMFPVLARFRAFATMPVVSDIPQIPQLVDVVSDIYDLDSTIAWMLRSKWLSEDEKTDFLAKQKALVTEDDFVACLQACAHHWPVAERVWRWHHWQSATMPEPLRQIVVGWGEPPAKQVTPLQWANQNCFIQTAVQMLATVRESLSLEHVMLPSIRTALARVDNGTVNEVEAGHVERLYQRLFPVLDIINTPPAAGTPAYSFTDLYSAVMEFHMRDRNPANIAGDTQSILEMLSRGPASMEARINRYLQSDWSINMYVRTAGGTLVQCPVHSVNLNNMYYADPTDMATWFPTPQPGVDGYPNESLSLQIAGSRLLYMRLCRDFATAGNFQVLSWLSFTTLSGATAIYVLRGASVSSPGHYSAVMHYPPPNAVRPDSKDPAVLDPWLRGGSWIHCNMSACSPIAAGFDAIRSGKLGGHTLSSFVYERIQ